MKDGLYRITTSYYCAGFVVKEGLIVSCAPILRGKIINVSKDYLLSISEYVCGLEVKK